MKKMSGLCSLFILRVCFTFCVFTNYTVMSSTITPPLQTTTSATLTSTDRNSSTSALSASLQWTASTASTEALSERNASTVNTSAPLQPTAPATLPETSATTAPKYVGTNSTDSTLSSTISISKSDLMSDPNLSSTTSTSKSDLMSDPNLSSTTSTSKSDLIANAESDTTKNTTETGSTTKSERVSETSTSTTPAADSSKTSSSPLSPPTVTSPARPFSVTMSVSPTMTSGGQEGKKSIAGAEVAAIVLCMLAVILLAAAIAVWWFRKRKVKRELSRLSDVDMNMFQNDHYNPAPSNENHFHSQTTIQESAASNIYTGEPTKQANQLHPDDNPKEEQKSLLSKPSDVITSNYDKSSDDNILDADAIDEATPNQALVVKSGEVIPEPESSLSTFAPEPVKQPSEISEFLYLEKDNQNPSQ